MITAWIVKIHVSRLGLLRVMTIIIKQKLDPQRFLKVETSRPRPMERIRDPGTNESADSDYERIVISQLTSPQLKQDGVWLSDFTGSAGLRAIR